LTHMKLATASFNGHRIEHEMVLAQGWRKWWNAYMCKELISPFQLQTITTHLQMKPTLSSIKL
jgi:hypothetical protein